VLHWSPNSTREASKFFASGHTFKKFHYTGYKKCLGKTTEGESTQQRKKKIYERRPSEA
jgi:hypothetical protein